MSVVYCVQETYNDISQALNYGTVEVLLPPGAQIAFSPAPTVRRIQRKLSKFTDED